MNVKLLGSVNAKIFYYMSALVLVTVAGTAFHYSRAFTAHQTEQARDALQLHAEQSAAQAKASIEQWRAQLAAAMPGLKGANAAEVSEKARRVVDTNPDFIGLALYTTPTPRSTKLSPLGDALTSAVTDNRFDDKQPSKLWTKTQGVAKRWLKREIPKMKKDSMRVESVSKSVGLPVMLLAVRFDSPDATAVTWAVLAVWQTRLIDALPRSKLVSAAIVDREGKVFTATDVADMLQRRTYQGGERLVRSAVAGTSPSGFEPDLKDARGRKRLGAYSRLPQALGLAVVVDADAEATLGAAKAAWGSTLLWLVLFLLGAFGLAYLAARGFTRSIREATYATTRIAGGDLQHQIVPTTQDEFATLSQAMNHMTNKVSQLVTARIDKARFEREAETAKLVQSAFFPREKAEGGAITVSGYYHPAPQCGGDLWGRCELEDGVELVYIADAMGLGSSAAMMTAVSYAAVTAITDLTRQHKLNEGPAQLLQRLNRVIHEATLGSITVTFFAAVFDMRRGILTYANAGHNFPVLLPAAANDTRGGRTTKAMRRVSDIAPISLALSGNMLGMEPEASFNERTIELRPGDKVFFFTDGLIECSSPQGSIWGRKHLLEQLVETAKLDGIAMKDEVLARAFSFFGNKPLEDDVAVVVVEVAKSWRVSSKAAKAAKTPTKWTPATTGEKTLPPPAPPARTLSSSRIPSSPSSPSNPSNPSNPSSPSAPSVPSGSKSIFSNPPVELDLTPTPEPWIPAAVLVEATAPEPDTSSDAADAPLPELPTPEPEPALEPAAPAPEPAPASPQAPAPAPAPQQTYPSMSPSKPFGSELVLPSAIEQRPDPSSAEPAPISGHEPAPQATITSSKGGKFKIKLPSGA